MARLWVRCGTWVVALGVVALGITPVRAQQYVFHRASCDPQAQGCSFTAYDFGQVVKRNTAVADLAVSMIGYFTIGPVDTNKVKVVFRDAANQLNFSSLINVEYSGDTVAIPIPIDPTACDTSGFGFCSYDAATIPFSVAFRPNERGIYEDTLTFIFSYPVPDTLKLPIRGTGIGFLALVSPSGQRVDSALYPLASTRVGDSLPGFGFPITVVNTSSNQLGKIEDVVMSNASQFHVVNPQLEIQPGQSAILSVQFSPQYLGLNSGWGKIVSDDFAVDTARMEYIGTGVLGLDYFTNDDTTDINGNAIHLVVPQLVTDTLIVGGKIDSLIWIQNKLNQNVETELLLQNNHNGFKLLRREGSLLSESDTLFFAFGGNPCRFFVDSCGPYRGAYYRKGDTIIVGPDTIPVGTDTVFFHSAQCDTLITDATIVPTTLARTLPLNDSMAVWVRFNPATRGTFIDSIATIYQPFIGSATKIIGLFGLEGTAIGPGFGYSRDTIDFGPLTPGLTLKDSVALSNPGQLAVDISIDTIGLDPVFRLLTESDFSYARNTIFYAVFQYAAVDNALHVDTVEITSTDPNNPGLSLVLTGGTQASVVVADPAALTFGDVVVSDSLALSLYVKNIGLTNLDVTGATTASPVFFVNPTAFSVVPGDSQLVSVRFVPTAAVAYQDTLRIASNDPKKPSFRVPISAGGSDPVYVSTGVLTFGATTLNAGSLVDSVGVRNGGTRGSLIASLSLLNGTYFSLAKPGDSVIFVPAGTTYQIAVRFRQSVPAVVYDSIRLITNAPATDTAYIVISGGGFFKQLSWTSGPLATTNVYDYGKVSVAVAETLKSVMTNLGNDTLHVGNDSLHIAGVSLYSGTAGFRRTSPASTSLLQREQFDVTVEFVPPGEGLFSDTMLILTDDTTGGHDSIVVPLSAQAYVPGLVSLAPSLVFDTTDIGAAIIDSMGFQNPGESAVTLASVSTVVGSRFYVAGFPPSVAADATGWVKVAFTPTDTLVYLDTLRVITTGPADTLRIPLQGAGAGGRYADNVTRLDFAPTPQFSTTQKSFIVTNVGNRSLSITNIASQSGSGDFQRLSPASLVLGPGEQSTVTVGFTPSISAAYRDTILVSTSDQSNTLVKIPVTGETPDRDINLARDRFVSFPDPELNIGAVKVATTGSKNLVIYNSGLSPLILRTADLKLQNSSFGFVKQQWTDTLTSRGTAGDSMFGAIRYQPLEKKAADTNWIIISSNDPDEDTLIVRLIASAVSGQLRIASSDSSVSFGTIKVGTLDTSVIVSVQNTFGNRVRLSYANFVHPPQADYTIQAAIHRVGQTRVFSNFDPANPPTLGTDSIISFRWIYHPTNTGTDADVFRVIGTPDNAGDTINIPVSGRGAAPSLAMSPTYLDYGTLKVTPPGWPVTFREISVSISNTGSDTLQIDTLRTVNAGAAHYNDTYVGTGFAPYPWRVPPGTARSFGIRAVVSERKVYYDTLQFINNDPIRDPFTFYARVVGTAPGDSGFVDTVRISDYEQDGSQIVVPLHLAFDQPIKRFSIPLHYKSAVYECVGLNFERTLLEGADGLVPVVDTAANTVAIKGNIIFGPLIQPDNFVGTVFAKMIFEARGNGSSADSSITFDTAFIAPDIAFAFEDGQSRVILPEFVTNQLNVVTGVDDDVLPVAFELEQNYPNPFNPQTTIAFSVPKAANVSLVVYNLLGQRIRTISEGFLSPGRYEFEWRGDDDRGASVSSGIYFYHLAADDFSETRKMVLMK
jgi:hypothetical protein